MSQPKHFAVALVAGAVLFTRARRGGPRNTLLYILAGGSAGLVAFLSRFVYRSVFDLKRHDLFPRQAGDWLLRDLCLKVASPGRALPPDTGAVAVGPHLQTSAVAATTPHEVARPGGDVASKARGPPPKPGHDEDKRLEPLPDDPRYFEGAQIGKAQRAAMGETGLNGRNTASFDPNSTLVRPSMRVLHGQAGERFGKRLRLDDIVIVPDFYVGQAANETYDSLAVEARRLHAEGESDLRTSSTYTALLARACQYFGLDLETSSVRLECSVPETETIVIESGSVPPQACTVFLAFGATQELTFWHTSPEDTVYFPLVDGSLLFLGGDVAGRWRHGIGAAAPGAGGHICLAVSGPCADVAEETALAPYGSQKKSSDRQTPCRNFISGRCSFGDRCRFSHGDSDDGTVSRSTFDPTTKRFRPSMRIITVPASACYSRPVSHDDVIIVPDFFNEADGWDIYYQLIKEMRQSQADGDRKAEWVPWHEGAHLLSQNPTGSPTFHSVLDKLRQYFSVADGEQGTRFNWYVDGSDWKPFHHDSAAFNAHRAKDQNCTIGVSFGASRELAFRHSKSEELVYFPQTNGMLFFFGRDANIRWQHGINALPREEQDGKGRISIILWGWTAKGFEEPGSPPMLDDDSRGKGKGMGKGKGGYSMHGEQRSGNDLCRAFLRGNCSYGSRCRFVHGQR